MANGTKICNFLLERTTESLYPGPASLDLAPVLLCSACLSQNGLTQQRKPKNRPQPPSATVHKSLTSGSRVPFQGTRLSQADAAGTQGMWGAREAGEQGWRGHGLSFPQLHKTGDMLQHSKVGSDKGKSFPGEEGERGCIFRSVTPAAAGVQLHPCIPPALPLLGRAWRGRQPSCLTRSDCSSSPWHKRHRKDFCSRQRVCLVVRKMVPPTLSLTHLAAVPAGSGVSQVERSPTAPCISSPPSILILIPPPNPRRTGTAAGATCRGMPGFVVYPPLPLQ